MEIMIVNPTKIKISLKWQGRDVGNIVSQGLIWSNIKYNGWYFNGKTNDTKDVANIINGIFIDCIFWC